MINQVVIFAGGKGTRLGINNAKCLVEIAGEPIINYIIREYQNQNVNKFHFCLGFYADEVIKHLNALNIDFTHSIDPSVSCGTWLALKNAEPFLDNCFFVTYGDSVAFCDLEFMYWHFLESGQKSMMSVSNYCSSKSNFCIDMTGLEYSDPRYRSTNLILPETCSSKGAYNFVEHGVSIFTKPLLTNPFNHEEKVFNFSDYFKWQTIGDQPHYANANYYQINTSEDVIAADATFTKFKTQSPYNFLDRDGTINKWDPQIYDHMCFAPVNELLEQLNDHDCVIVTNQPDKAKTTATFSDINRMTWEARQHLIDHGKNVIFSMSCIHRACPKIGDVFDELRFACKCRKPETGMLEKAAKRISICKSSTFYGDNDCDEECAKSFGLQFIKMYN